MCWIAEPAVLFRHGGSHARCIDSGRLPAMDRGKCVGDDWHLNHTMFGPAGDEQGQGQPPRVSESTTRILLVRFDRFDVGRDCLLKLSLLFGTSPQASHLAAFLALERACG